MTSEIPKFNLRRKLNLVDNNLNLIYFCSPGFESADTSSYDIIIVDPWTWAAKGTFSTL